MTTTNEITTKYRYQAVQGQKEPDPDGWCKITAYAWNQPTEPREAAELGAEHWCEDGEYPQCGHLDVWIMDTETPGATPLMFRVDIDFDVTYSASLVEPEILEEPTVELAPHDDTCVGCGREIVKGAKVRRFDEGLAHAGGCPEEPNAAA